MAWLKETKSVAPQPRSGVKVWSGAAGVRESYVHYNPRWSPERVLKDALAKVTWVYRCMDAIASNAARLPIVIREDDRWTGEPIEMEDINKVLNRRSNPGEDSFAFRYRLSAQVLLSEKGAFIEVLRDKGGNVAELRLIPPDMVEPIPDGKTFVSGYNVMVPNARGTLEPQRVAPEKIIWIKKPHPFDPYRAMTPLEAAGVAIETDWLAKMYNRSFLMNDGRPGGMVVIKGDVMEEDKEELQARFRGNPMTAGRITVVSSEEGADFVDTATSPRDAQYIESRKATKEEILMAFGVPETVLANAAGRCVDAETEAFTQRGWVNGYELTTDDTILSVDPADGELKWSPIHEVYRNENYSGDMWRIKNSSADFLVTPGHNWLVSSRGRKDKSLHLKKVEDLTQMDSIITIGSAENSILEPEFSDAFVELVGWAVTEGHYFPNATSLESRPNRLAPYVRISQNLGEGHHRIEMCLKEVGASYSITSRTDRLNQNDLFNVRGEIAAAIQHVSPGRVMTKEFILSLTASQRELLLQTMIDADGARQDNTSSLIFTQKDPLAADAFAYLATLAGYTTSSKDEEYDYEYNGEVKRATRRRIIVRSQKTMSIQHGARTKEHYEGFVWCPRTDYGTFVSRRHGRVVLTGNTFDNAEMERLIFWMETMIPHLELIMRPLDILDGDDSAYVSFDLSMVDVLQRMEMKRKEYHLRELDGAAISVDEYREATGRAPIGNGMGRILILASTKAPYLTTDGEELELPHVGPEIPEELQPDGSNNPNGRTPTGDVVEEPEEDPVEREDDRNAPLGNEPQKAELPPSVAGELESQIKFLEQLTIKSSSVEVGGVSVDKTALAEFKNSMLTDIDRTAASISSTSKRFLERQKRVLGEKLAGQKMRRFMEKRKEFIENSDNSSSTPYHVSLKAAVETIYNQKVWDDALEEDMRPMIREIIEKNAKAMQEEIGSESEIPSILIEAMVAKQMIRMLEINNTTRNKISEILSAGALADIDSPEMAKNLQEAFDQMIDTRPDAIGITEAVAAINGGRHIAAQGLAGATKIWTSLGDDRVRPTHDDSDGQEVPVNDLFTVGDGKMQYPGDPAGPTEEVANCRCSVIYSNGERLYL